MCLEYRERNSVSMLLNDLNYSDCLLNISLMLIWLHRHKTQICCSQNVTVYLQFSLVLFIICASILDQQDPHLLGVSCTYVKGISTRICDLIECDTSSSTSLINFCELTLYLFCIVYILKQTAKYCKQRVNCLTQWYC